MKLPPKSRLFGQKDSPFTAHNLQAVFDSMPDALCVFDRRGRLVAFNPAAETALGEPLEPPYLGRSIMPWSRRARVDRLRDRVGLSPTQLQCHILEILTKSAQTTRRQFQQMRHNAAHYIDEVGMQANAVRLCVKGTGPGIPPTERNRVFDKSAQRDWGAPRGRKGTGLGLTFCRLAVEAHGGRVWAEDSNVGGTTFCFILPIAHDDPQERSHG